MNPNMMQGFFKDMKMSPDEMKQAQHIWGMLDDMANNDPDAYKKFIQTNVSEGFENAKKEREKEIKTMGVKPQVGYLLRMDAVLTTVPLTEDTNGEFAKFIIKKEEEKPATYPETVRIYLNICFSGRVLRPLTKAGVLCERIEDQQNWFNIPVSFSEFSTSKKQYEDITNYFFIAIINEELYSFVQQKRGQVIQSIQNYILEKLQFRLKTDRNPIKNHSKTEYTYYKIQPTSITIRKKKFKYHGMVEPKEQLLDLDTDVDFYKKRQKMAQEKEIKTKEAAEKSEIKLETLLPTSKPATNSKPLIQEIVDTSSKNKLEYTIADLSDKFVIEISLNEEDLTRDFDLDASENIVKLKVESKDPLTINLKHKINPDNMKATLKKKKKMLIIEAHKI